MIAAERAEAEPVWLSVVVAFYDEARALDLLHAELVEALADASGPIEFVYVDDGSRDDGPSRIEALAASDARVRLLRLSPRSGQSAALWAGFRAARGEFVATLDADLQNDPADLPVLLAAMSDADCVCGIRIVRRDGFWTRLASRAANAIRRRVLGDAIQDIGCSLRVMRAEPLGRVPFFRGAHRFLPVLLAQQGARVIEKPVGHRPRRFGQSHYDVLGRLRVAWVDLLGVAWLARRTDRYDVKELTRPSA